LSDILVLGDADGACYEHALELFRAHGGGKMDDMHGLSKITPGDYTRHKAC